jgi:hypothetical protein
MTFYETSADELRDALVDADFPATPDALAAYAGEAGARAEVVRALRALPPVDYGNVEEVVRSARLDPEPGRSAARRADQARERRENPRLAEHMRDVR